MRAITNPEPKKYEYAATRKSKRCSVCKEIGGCDEFHMVTFEKLGKQMTRFSSMCRKCNTARMALRNKDEAYIEKQREYRKEYSLRTRHKSRERVLGKYGLTVEQYETMKLEQDSKCSICSQEKPLVVDHCHATGKVRSLLCSTCNSAIGLFSDSTATVLSAAMYLEKHGRL